MAQPSRLTPTFSRNLFYPLAAAHNSQAAAMVLMRQSRPGNLQPDRNQAYAGSPRLRPSCLCYAKQ